MTLSEFQFQGACEWCKKSGQLRAIRDWEEALTGPEYWVCPECVEKEREGFEVASAGVRPIGRSVWPMDLASRTTI